MGSTPSAAAGKDENPAETPEPSSNRKAGDQAGDRPHARKKKSTARKKAVTKKAARKAAAARKTATRKKASGKSAGGKSIGSEAAARKAFAKKAVRKKAAGRKSASSKAASEKKTTSRSRKRPGLAGFTATKSAGEVADKAAATSGDPRSLSWMAASAVEALNAVKAHQAETATHIRETREPESGLPEADLDDIFAADPVASSPQELASSADGRELPAGVGV